MIRDAGRTQQGANTCGCRPVMYFRAPRPDNHSFDRWLLSGCCVSAAARVEYSSVLKFLQDEFAGLRSRWLRILALLTCLCLAGVVAQQQRAIEAQGNLIQALT